MDIDKMKFPIGVFTLPTKYSDELIKEWILILSSFPSKINTICSQLSEDQLNWKYRPEGWSIKQVVHHCADSHMNSFIRFKLALTEDKPIIKPYEEANWANLIDSLDNDLQFSIKILEGIHGKWTLLLNSLNEQQLNRLFIHPSSQQEISLHENIGIYAWHCNHHYAHIEQALKYQGEFN